MPKVDSFNRLNFRSMMLSKLRRKFVSKSEANGKRQKDRKIRFRQELQKSFPHVPLKIHRLSYFYSYMNLESDHDLHHHLQASNWIPERIIYLPIKIEDC